MRSRRRPSSNPETSRRYGYEPIAQLEAMGTPPTYVVRETSDGRLSAETNLFYHQMPDEVNEAESKVNDSYGVEWPNRPTYGRYATQSQEVVSTEIAQKKRRQHNPVMLDPDEISVGKGKRSIERSSRETTESSEQLNDRSDSGNKSQASMGGRKNGDCDDYLFAGALTMSEVAKLLRPNDFRLYYQISSSQNTVPIHIPLYLAYMSSAGKVYHFPIVCSRDDENGREAWHVLYGEPRPASFATLPALVKYHKIYSYMDPKTGAIDTFPVWKGTIIDMDDSDS